MAHIITIGNEKGGAGKSTLSMHLACGLMYSGARIGMVDIDIRQRTFERFINNRASYAAENSLDIPMPIVGSMPKKASDLSPEKAFGDVLDHLNDKVDYILLDCPGALTRLSEMAHALANTLVTPLNDSFIDFDLLGQVDSSGDKVLRPSLYAEMVWNARQERQRQGFKPLDWVVVRNRLARQNMHNKRKVSAALQNLSNRIGFRLVPGLSDRVIFKELFPKGMTILDPDAGSGFSLSNIAAKQEIRDLLTGLNLPDFEVGF
ncbi:MAG: division plane positioning ATPase MipZ [Pseudomonadota bacterium]